MTDRNVSDYLACEFRVHVENAYEVAASCFKIDVCGYGFTKVSCTYKYGLEMLVYSEYLAYFHPKLVNVIAISLLTKSAKAVKVLSYL